MAPIVHIVFNLPLSFIPILPMRSIYSAIHHVEFVHIITKDSFQRMRVVEEIVTTHKVKPFALSPINALIHRIIDSLVGFRKEPNTSILRRVPPNYLQSAILANAINNQQFQSWKNWPTMLSTQRQMVFSQLYVGTMIVSFIS